MSPHDDDTGREIMAITPANHPLAEDLRRFALGRLDRRAMARVEAHLGGCLRCADIAAKAPHDRLVALLRRPVDGPDADERDGIAPDLA